MRNKVRSLKILHVIPSIAACRGGPSKAVIEMVKHLRNLGVDAEIATTNDDGPNELKISLNTLIDHKGVPTRFFKRFSPPVNAAREFAYSGEFRRWLSGHINDYDVIHIHAVFSFVSSYAMHLARKRGIPYVVRPIGQLQPWSLQQSRFKKTLYLRAIEKANIEAASAMHFTAKSEQQESEQHFKLRGHVIPLGIELPDQPLASSQESLSRFSLADTSTTILYLSRLHEKKGLELVMQALAKFKTVDFKLLIAGDGEPDYKNQLKRLSRRLNLDQKCSFLGHIEGDTKAALLHQSDLFVLTSYSENFGISVLEAMGSALAPLISNNVALASIVADHDLGLVCTTNVESIESQLKFVFNNQKKVNAKGLRAQEYAAKHYSWPNIAKQLESLYISIT